MTFSIDPWDSRPLDKPQEEQARLLLQNPAERGRWQNAFLQLLRSNDPEAVRLSLRWYSSAQAMCRHGMENPVGQCSAEVLTRCREILHRASHANLRHCEAALDAMMNQAHPTDADLIASILNDAALRYVHSSAITASISVLRETADPNQRLISALQNLVLDENVKEDNRSSALRSLSNVALPYIIEFLVTALHLDSYEVQTCAASILLRIDSERYRELIEPVASAWPSDVPYPGREVLDLLYGGHVDDDEADEDKL